MADYTLRTVIQFKRDSAVNWETNKDVIPAAGEPCYDLDAGTLKIGDGVTAYENLPAIYAGEIPAAATHYEGTREGVESDMDVIARVLADVETPTNKDDIFVVKALIADGKYSHTAYVYNGEQWAAMDGNYNAENVYFDEDLTTTYALGNYSLSNGSATIPALGKNLKQLWDAIYLKEDTTVTISNPAISLSVANSGQTVEVGSTFTRPTATLKIDGIGSYQYGSKDVDGTEYTSTTATNVTFSRMKVGFGSNIDSTTDYAELTDGGYVTKQTLTYTADSDDIASNYVAEGDTSFTFCAEAHHTASDRYPITNLGNFMTGGSLSNGTFTATTVGANAKDAEGNVIAKGNIQASVADGLEKTATWKITGYREGFYFGTSETEIAPADLTSNIIRNLGTKSGGNYASGKKNVTIPVGAKTVIIACPSNKTGVTDVLNTTVNANMNESFGVGGTPAKVTVGGNDATADSVGNFGREYNVWTFTPPEAYGTAASLTITLG